MLPHPFWKPSILIKILNGEKINDHVLRLKAVLFNYVKLMFSIAFSVVLLSKC